MYLLGGRLGYTFSQGAIDYGLFFANGIKPWLVLIVGPIYFVVYFVVFYGLIRLFKMKTPGPRGRGRSTCRTPERTPPTGSPSNSSWPSAAGATSRTWTPASPGCGSA